MKNASHRSVHIVGLALGLALLACSTVVAEDGAAEEQFEGFPPIGKYRPGERSFTVITSDAITGVLRPKWTRAMGDLGGWPAMVRFKESIYFVFPHLDGHRYKQFEATGDVLCYASPDEGRTWVARPNLPFKATPEFVVAGDALYGYDWDDKAKGTTVRITRDGSQWSEPVEVYKRPFCFWGVMYDSVSKQFWAPPHAIPSLAADPGRQIHLVNSQDGIHWEYVSTVAPYDNASESVLRFEEDRTMVVLVRRKYGRTVSLAVAKPPYKEWTISELPLIAEGDHFYELGGQTFLASRANYSGDNADVNANQLFDNRKSYSLIYRFTKERTLEPWAVMDSMGDCSYPTLVETPTEILCAYYSQHEDKVCKAYLCAFDKEAFFGKKQP